MPLIRASLGLVTVFTSALSNMNECQHKGKACYVWMQYVGRRDGDKDRVLSGRTTVTSGRADECKTNWHFLVVVMPQNDHAFDT